MTKFKKETKRLHDVMIERGFMFVEFTESGREIDSFYVSELNDFGNGCKDYIVTGVDGKTTEIFRTPAGYTDSQFIDEMLHDYDDLRDVCNIRFASIFDALGITL
jgi:hypothetical protein